MVAIPETENPVKLQKHRGRASELKRRIRRLMHGPNRRPDWKEQLVILNRMLA